MKRIAVLFGNGSTNIIVKAHDLSVSFYAFSLTVPSLGKDLGKLPSPCLLFLFAEVLGRQAHYYGQVDDTECKQEVILP